MTNPFAGIGLDANRSGFFARQRIESEINLPRLFSAIDADPAIVGAGVVYIDADFNVVTLREFRPMCSIRPKRVILREAQKHLAPQQFIQQLQHHPRESRVVMEAVNTSLTCAGALLSWSVVSGGSVLIPFSAGTSGVVVAIAWTGAIAGGAQCLNGLFRTGVEVAVPEFNDWLDSEDWYQNVSIGLDAASLLGVGVSALTTVRLVRVTKKATGKTLQEVLRGLNRQERAKLTKELLSINHPSLTSKVLKLKQRAWELPKRFTSTQIKQGTIAQIKGSLGAASGLASSALSGNVKTIAIGMYEEFDE